MFIEVTSSGAIRFLWEYGSGSNVDLYSAAGTISISRWHHVAMIRYPISANYGVKVYINGSLAETIDNGGTGYTAPAGGTSGVPYIGRTAEDSSAVNYYAIDSIRVYDTDESSNVINVYTTESPSFDALLLPMNQVAPEIVAQSRNPSYGSVIDSSPSIEVQTRESSYGGLARTGPSLALVEPDRRNVGFYR